ncbi:MAG: peptidoglycan DD-metalloendopeptidase family protein, partial [Bacteroidales bacterium]|nr:peptidoglycan DD-metalloendopeptidase family protein [Bacteroidales bacterium]
MSKRMMVKILLPVMLMLPLVVEAQIHERGMMKNRTNVEIESSSYTIGIVKDTAKFQSSFIQFVNNSIEDDVSAESEDDILVATFDNGSVHSYQKKFDYTSITEPIEIQLVNNDKKQYYACPFEGRVTSHFGPRRRRWHYGVDLGLRTGQPIKAMFDGRVRIAKRAGAYGNLVVIRHNNGLETYYAHLSKINVELNQDVKAGEVLGLGGSTGRSTGPHLHLEIRYLGAAINPEKVIDFSTFQLKSDTLHLTREYFKNGGRSSSSSKRQLANNSSSKASKGGKYYTVRKGDTLGAIAKRNGTTVKKLAQLNNIKGSKIRAGQKIRLR